MSAEKHDQIRVQYCRNKMAFYENAIREINNKRIGKTSKYKMLSQKDRKEIEFYFRQYKEYSNKLSLLLSQ